MIKTRLTFIFLSLFIMVNIPTLSHAKDNNVAEDLIETIFSEVERTIIEEYFGKEENRKHKNHKSKKDKKHHKGKGKGNSNNLPPGLAKKDKLPPGLSMQLEKNGTLPPGLAKRDLPDDLMDMLPKTRKGTKRIIIDNDVVLIEKGTEIILDILKDVILPPEWKPI